MYLVLPVDITTSTDEQHLEPLFSSTPSGRVAASSVASRAALELFASSLRSTVGGQVVGISVSPYRDDARVRWQCHVHGVEDSVSMTFLEAGRTRLPLLTLEGPSSGELADAVDAYHLFEFLKRELLTESTVF